jgi:hypothetical protein
MEVMGNPLPVRFLGPSSRQSPDAPNKLARRDGFHHILTGAGVETREPARLSTDGGQHHDGNARGRRLTARKLAYAQSIQVRQQDVQHEIRNPLAPAAVPLKMQVTARRDPVMLMARRPSLAKKGWPRWPGCW